MFISQLKPYAQRLLFGLCHGLKWEKMKIEGLHMGIAFLLSFFLFSLHRYTAHTHTLIPMWNLYNRHTLYICDFFSVASRVLLFWFVAFVRFATRNACACVCAYEYNEYACISIHVDTRMAWAVYIWFHYAHTFPLSLGSLYWQWEKYGWIAKFPIRIIFF